MHEQRKSRSFSPGKPLAARARCTDLVVRDGAAQLFQLTHCFAILALKPEPAMRAKGSTKTNI